jgi:hypothetical protein
MRKTRLQLMLGGTRISIKEILYIIFATLCIWISITSAIQGFKCDSMTQAQLFKRIPHTIVLDFIECDNKYKN